MARQLETEYRRRLETRTPAGPEPKLLARFDLNSISLPEAEFSRAGLQLLDSSAPRKAVVYAPDPSLRSLRNRLARYERGPRPKQVAEDEEPAERGAEYEGFFDSVDRFGSITPPERISPRLQHALDALPEGDVLVFEAELFFPPDETRRADWIAEVRDAVDLNGEELDFYEGAVSGVILLRLRGGAELVSTLAALEQVVVLDTVPEPDVDEASIAELQDIERIPDPLPVPPDDAVLVGLVDTGLTSGHPLFATAVRSDEVVALHPAFGGQAEDGHGHGTRMAGRIIFGDVLVCARIGIWQPACELASVRVLGDDGRPPDGASYVKLIVQAIDELVEMEARVINLSVSDTASPYLGAHSAPLAAVIDTLIARHHLLVLTCTGNLRYDQLAPQAQLLSTWPDYLRDDDDRRLLSPGQAALALTAGAVSGADAVGEGPPTAAVSIPRGPAPFTRKGPGVGGAVKPELVADGGNWAYDRDTGDQRSAPALGVLSTSADITRRLFEFSTGTSVAAAWLSHVAARIMARYPDVAATTVRALMLVAAGHDGRETLFAGMTPGARRDALLALAGYGEVDLARCEYSTDSRVVLYGQDTLQPDHFHVYRLPLTESFKQVQGRRTLAVALSYESPVRHRRLDYLGTRFEFLVVKGLTEDAVFDAASAEVRDVEPKVLSKAAVDLQPSRSSRSAGANQMATKTWEQRLRARSVADDWFLLVRSTNRWLRPEHGAQPYSVAVTFEVEQAEQLHAEFETAIELPLEAQLRV